MNRFFAAIEAAISRALGISSSRVTTASSAPSRNASRAEIGSPVKSILRTFWTGAKGCN